MADLLALTAELVDIPSVSHDEGAITERIEASCAATPWLDRRSARRQPRGPHRARPLARLVLAGHTDTVPVNGNGEREDRGRHALGLRGVRHEGGPRRDARAGAHGLRPRRRRHLRVLRSGGGRRRPQRARAGCFASGPTCWRATSRCSASPPTARSRPGARARCASARPRPVPGPTPPVRGWDATPSTGSVRSFDGSNRTRSAGR